MRVYSRFRESFHELRISGDKSSNTFAPARIGRSHQVCFGWPRCLPESRSGFHGSSDPGSDRAESCSIHETAGIPAAASLSCECHFTPNAVSPVPVERVAVSPLYRNNASAVDCSRVVATRLKYGPFPEEGRERPGCVRTPFGSEEGLSRKLKAVQRSEVPVDYGALFVDQLHPEVDSGNRADDQIRGR